MRAYLHAVSFFHEAMGTEFDPACLGTNAVVSAPLAIPKPEGIDAMEMRRLTATNRLALYLTMAAVKKTTFNPAVLGSVFSSAHGDSEIFDEICKTLGSDAPELSPSKFSHSLLNTAAGIWGIATHSEQRSISVSAGDYTLGMGLLEALLMVAENPTVFVCYSTKTPDPLRSNYLVNAHCGFAMVLTYERCAAPIAELNVQIIPSKFSPQIKSCGAHLSLEKTMPQIYPLLNAAHQGKREELQLDLSPHQKLRVEVKWLS